MMKRLITVLLATGLSLPALADNLLDIYQLAKSNDPQFRAAEAGINADKEIRKQARSVLLPQINLSAHKTEHTDETISPVASTTDYESKGYTLSLTQTLYHHDYYVQLNQADAQVAQAVSRQHDAEQALIVRVAEAYFNAQAARDNLEFARAEKIAITRQLQQAKQRFQVGLTAITDVHEAQARYDQAVAQDIVAENQVAISLEALREITGQAHDELQTLGNDSPLLMPEPQDITHWVNAALAQNMQLKIAEKAMQIASDEVSRQRAGHYPTFDLVASKTSGEIDTGPFAGETEDTRVSVQVNLPIFSGGYTSSKTREAAYRYQQAKDTHEQIRRLTERTARNAYLGVIANISQVNALKQALASSQTALEATQAGFEVGTRTAVDVLDSQRQMYLAKRNYARARYDYIIETLRLKQAAGILAEQDVAQVNQWLQ